MALLNIFKKKQKTPQPALSFDSSGKASVGTATSNTSNKAALTGSGSPTGSNSLLVTPKTSSAITTSSGTGKPLLQQGATVGSTNINLKPYAVPGPDNNATSLQVTSSKPKTTTALAGTPTSTPPPTTSSGYTSTDPAVSARIKAMSDAATASANAQRAASSPSNGTIPSYSVQGATTTNKSAPAQTSYTPPTSSSSSVIDELRGKIGTLSAPSAEEQALQDQLTQLQGDAAQGIAGLEGQGRGIPLSLVRGKQAKLGEQAQLQEQTLMDRLANMSAQRQAELTAAQNEYQIAADEQQRQDQLTAPQTVGNSILRYNPTTGQYETAYTAPAQAQDQTTTIQEYEYAKQNGYTGSFVDYQTARQGGSGDGNKLLSPTEATALGVPYGTTQAQAAAMGIQPQKTLSAEAIKLQENAKSGLDSLATIRGDIGDGKRQVVEDRTYKAAEANLSDVIGRLRSGGAITGDEEKRFKSLLPSILDSHQTATNKLNTLENLLTGVLQSNSSSSSGGGDDIDQFLDSFSSAGRALNGTSAKAVATNYPAGSDGGQCGRFVNRLTGLQMGNSYQSKMAYVDPSIKTPQPGYTFVMPYKQFGHTGIVADEPLRPQPDGSFDIPVIDSNWNLDEKVSHHYINSKQISGYVPTTPSAQRVSLA